MLGILCNTIEPELRFSRLFTDRKYQYQAGDADSSWKLGRPSSFKVQLSIYMPVVMFLLLTVIVR